MADQPFECWHEKARVQSKYPRDYGTLRLYCPTCGLAVGVNPKWVGVVGDGLGAQLSPRTKARVAREEGAR